MNLDLQNISAVELTDLIAKTEKSLKEKEEAIIEMEKDVAELEARNDYLADLIVRANSVKEITNGINNLRTGLKVYSSKMIIKM